MTPYGRHGLPLRLVCLAIAVACWVATGLGRWRRDGVVTLCYHGVRAGQAARFRRQMTRITRRVVGPAGMRAASAEPRSGPPRVCVTFDDAFANLLETALPVTRELGLPVTVFVVTGNLGSRPAWAMADGHPDAGEVTMSATQIRDAAADHRITWGSHGATHRPLTDLPPAEVTVELAASAAALEDLLGWRVEDFAFPYGACSEQLVAAAADCGYRRVYTLDSSLPRFGDVDVVGRMAMSPDAWPIEFVLTAAGAYGWLPRCRTLLRRLRGAGRQGRHPVTCVEGGT